MGESIADQEFGAGGRIGERQLHELSIAFRFLAMRAGGAHPPSLAWGAPRRPRTDGADRARRASSGSARARAAATRAHLGGPAADELGNQRLTPSATLDVAPERV